MQKRSITEIKENCLSPLHSYFLMDTVCYILVSVITHNTKIYSISLLLAHFAKNCIVANITHFEATWTKK